MNIKIAYNANSNIQARVIKKKLIDNGFNIVEDLADIVFIIGGDGTFLRSLRKLNYSTHPIYVGINSGNLGYLQDISCAQIDDLITFLKQKDIDEYVNKISLAKIKFIYKDGTVKEDNAINELQISGKKYHKMKFSLSDCIDLKENVTASGIILSTPYGSTAYNKSIGGPIICNGIDVICATLFAPIQNSKTEDYIPNSLVGKRFGIELLSDYNDIDMFIDGQEIEIDKESLLKIEVEIGNKNIYKLNYNNKSYSKNMSEKLIKNSP